MDDLNIIMETFKTLGVILVAISFVGLLVTQHFKEVWNWDGTKALILSYVSGFILAALPVLTWLSGQAWKASVGQWSGIFLFMVVGTLSPSGGYKTLRSMLGIEES